MEDWEQREKRRKAAKNLTLGTGIFGLVFILFWCGMAVWMEAGFMLLFGIPMFILCAYRLYKVLTLNREEPEHPGGQEDQACDYRENPAREEDQSFCPYCGCPREESYSFCPKCGRRI